VETAMECRAVECRSTKRSLMVVGGWWLMCGSLSASQAQSSVLTSVSVSGERTSPDLESSIDQGEIRGARRASESDLSQPQSLSLSQR
jgi:hypothetical protein